MRVVCFITVSALAFVLIGCAASEPGWTGSGEPFDGAKAACEASTTTNAGFEACMLEKGWRRL